MDDRISNWNHAALVADRKAEPIIMPTKHDTRPSLEEWSQETEFFKERESAFALLLASNDEIVFGSNSIDSHINAMIMNNHGFYVISGVENILSLRNSINVELLTLPYSKADPVATTEIASHEIIVRCAISNHDEIKISQDVVEFIRKELDSVARIVNVRERSRVAAEKTSKALTQ